MYRRSHVKHGINYRLTDLEELTAVNAKLFPRKRERERGSKYGGIMAASPPEVNGSVLRSV